MSTWETAKPVNFREIHILWILKHRLGVINHNANLGKNMFFKMFVGKWPTAVLNIFPYYVKQWLDILKTSASCAKGRLVWPIPIWCWWLGLVVPWVWPRIWGHWPYEAYGAWGDWEGRGGTLWLLGNLFRSSQSHSLPLPVIFSQLNRW